MGSGCSPSPSPSLRRPRTHANRKPRLWSRLFGEQQQKEGLEKKVSKKSSLKKKASSFQDHAGEKTAHGPTSDCYPRKGILNAEEGAGNQILKASHGKNRQRARHRPQQECFQKTMETSHGSSESNGNGSVFPKEHLTEFKPDIVASPKIPNDFAGQSHDDSAICKAGLPSRTQNYRRRVAVRKSCDEDLDREQFSRQKSYHCISPAPSSARNACSKANAGVVWNKELEQSSRRKSSNKQFQIKKGAPFKADEMLHQPDEHVRSKQEIEKWSTVKKSSFVPEVKSNQHCNYAQEITSDCNGQAWEEESSGEDAINGFNNPRAVQLKKHAFGNQEIVVANKGGELQLPTVRKSSRIPKKRVFDDDDEALLQRQKNKLLKNEPSVEQTQLEESIDGAVNERNANDYCGRESTGTLSDDQCANECNGRESNNDADEPCLGGKKEALLTACQGHKENLTDAEQAIKKEEAARRRKLQMEKNAKEIQEVAIQKILGQESSRKKREEKLQRQRQEIEQEKQAAAMAPPVNSIRWVMGPSGNVVLFSQDLELPKIFSGPCSYPQEREKCAGPSCNNVYKYRDSKTRLPLCSLQCYRAVQELPRTGPAF